MKRRKAERPSIPKTIRTVVKERLKARFGYRIVKPTYPSLGEDVQNALEAMYRAAWRPSIVRIPLADCRGGRELGFPCTEDSPHPFIQTVRGFRDGSVTDYRGSPLQRYYEMYQPKNVGSVLGVGGEAAYARRSPLCAAVPWTNLSPEAAADEKREVMQNEAREHHMDAAGDADWKYWGPVSQEAGQLEFRRLREVFRSITENGYRRHDGEQGDIEALYLLVRDGEARVQISGGQHRLAVMAAIGHATVPVRVERWSVVRRDDARLWPAVRAARLTEAEAVAVFDRIFAGVSPPELARAWEGDRDAAVA